MSDDTTAAGDPSVPAQSAPTQHLAYMDGLRGIAILLVVACHGAKYAMDFHQGWTYHALAEGAHGVDLFFVISGFCLAYPILRRRFDTGAVKFDVLRFYCRRIIRIVPAYWVAFLALLAVSLIVVARGIELPWPAVKLPPTFSNGAAQLFFLNSATNLCGSFWTLAVEFRWYIAFPIIMWLYIRWPWTIYALMAATLVVYHFVLRQIDFATLPGFLLGIIAADLAIRGSRLNRFALGLFVAGVLASLWLEPKGHLDYALQNQLWWQVAAFFLVLAGVANGVVQRVLTVRWLAWIGIAAYSIYLYHDPVEAWYAFSGGQSLILAMIAGVLIGALGWLFVERYVMVPTTRDRLVAALEQPLRRLMRFLKWEHPSLITPAPAPQKES